MVIFSLSLIAEAIEGNIISCVHIPGSYVLHTCIRYVALYYDVERKQISVYFSEDNIEADEARIRVLCPVDITDGRWHHIAIVIVFPYVFVYVDGVRLECIIYLGPAGAHTHTLEDSIEGILNGSSYSSYMACYQLLSSRWREEMTLSLHIPTLASCYLPE